VNYGHGETAAHSIRWRALPCDESGDRREAIFHDDADRDRILNHIRNAFRSQGPGGFLLLQRWAYGRGAGVGCGLGVGVTLGFGDGVPVGVGVGVAVAVTVGVGVGVGVDVAMSSQVSLKYPLLS
jgi:hypothetical protein